MAVGNLPAEVSSFVGRRDDIVDATAALGLTRLLTLSGPGGVGKTRLALRIAREVSAGYPDGVWFVPLAEVVPGSAVAPSVLRALGARDDAPDAVAALEAHLAGRKLLLVLDNCEHVLAETVSLTTRLLRSADGLTVLATSRHVLGAEGERVTAVRPLRTADTSSGRSEASELFHARAVAAGADLDAATVDRVDLVCRRLDGMPLALELAAVRLRSIPLDELVRHLDDILPLLAAAGPASGRHEALDATLSWSHALCDESERRAWRLLSVFHGPFDIDAAQAVLGGDRTEVLRDIGRLLDKSVVLRRQGQGPPYALLETIRQYGRRMLREDPAGRSAVLRHRRYYFELAGRGAGDYFGPRDLEWFQAVGNGRTNLRVAFVEGLDDPETRTAAIDAILELRPYWAHTGLTREGMELVRRALAVEPDDDEIIGRLLCAGAQLAALLGLADEARTLAERCERTSPVPRVTAELIEHRALLALLEGRLDEALDLALEAAERLERCGAAGAVSDTLLVACTAGLETGDARTDALAERNLALTREAGGRLTRATACWVIGVLAWRNEDFDAANSSLDEALELFVPFEESMFVGMTLEAKACLSAALGRPRLAARLFGACKALWSGGPPFPRRISDRLTRDARAALRRALGSEYDELLAEGATLSRSAAIAAALRPASEEPGNEKAPRSEAADAVAKTLLTRREQEVALLVAEGLSNRAIAERLVVAQRTAEAHVEHIRVKLGYHSRAQIAAWVARGGDTGTLAATGDTAPVGARRA